MINFAVVGCGHIGKRHAEMIRRNPACELLALCDIKPKKDLAIDMFDVPFFHEMEQMIVATPEIHVICICTPNGLHAQQSIIALNHRKHVVCEKPMGLTKAACEAVIFKALNVSRQVFCVMQNRYSPPAIWLKEIMSQDLLGKIFQVQVNCFWNRDDRYYFPEGEKHPWKGSKALDGGTLFTQFSHFVDIMYWLFGDITNITARVADFKHQHSTDFEDSGIVLFDFVKGGMGCINYSTAVWDKNFESSLTIIAEKGTVKVGGQYMNDVVYTHINGYEMPDLPPANPPNDYGHYKGSANNHGFVFDNVVNVVRGKKEIATNAMEGLKVVDIIERIYTVVKTKLQPEKP